MATDILLVKPVFLKQNTAERELMSPYFPLGLFYLAAFLRERSFQVDILDGTFQEGPEDFQKALRRLKPKTVGFSVVQPNRNMALALARKAKENGATVIFGGPDPTLYPHKYLLEADIDFVVHHEGELTISELLEHLLNPSSNGNGLSQIEGIGFRTAEDEVVITPRRSYVLNLDELPQPARDMVNMYQYLQVWREQNGYASLTISILRGCPYGCEWCCRPVELDGSPQNQLLGLLRQPCSGLGCR